MSYGKPGILNQPAPNWEVDNWVQLPDEVKTIDVGDYKRKVIYLYNFQSWCPGCHTHGFPAMQHLISTYKDNENVVFVAIQTAFEGFTANTEATALKTAQKYDLSIPVGHSGSSKKRSAIMMKYRTGGTPWTVIIDKKGIVRFNEFNIEPTQGKKLIDRLLAEQ